MTPTVGKVYAMTPQPPVAENTHWFPAGNLTIGVEYRDVDPEGLVATYRDDPAMLAELLERSPEGGFTDEGVSIHVSGTADSHEYLRFDVFDAEPHYHYNHPGEPVVNNVVEFDAVAHGDMLDWALDCLRTRLPAMLHEAGGGDLVHAIDQSEVERALQEVEPRARSAQQVARAVQDASGSSARSVSSEHG